MHGWKLWSALALMAAAVAPAHAAPIATLSATFDGFLDNSVFTVTNQTALPESLTFLTKTGPTTSVGPFTVAAMGTYTYSFNALNGGYLPNPEEEGTADTTLYAFQVVETGVNLTSAYFSPISNATGAYVDFLGNTCQGFGPCPVATSGVVATLATATAVPEPASIAFVASGLVALGAVRRRRS